MSFENKSIANFHSLILLFISMQTKHSWLFVAHLLYMFLIFIVVKYDEILNWSLIKININDELHYFFVFFLFFDSYLLYLFYLFHLFYSFYFDMFYLSKHL